ncbi:Hyaluronan synthase [Rosistilla ulvae]|uniref:Hyaluronan synthase n=1 Tax=Rosistilla ulvae TaxID=1930277 RepID=A0A517M0F0_9BACT|nr:glycosyltransferase family A protein [Rosistilla ulvae]QDS88347.1 Hyaluronan synthase [Rosistilla ulvae]
MNDSTISVVIPCYNGASYLDETLRSALAQTHRPLEILLVDDGSTDNSVEIAESFAPHVTVYRQPNSGESVARNRGIELAKGDFVAFLDADDLWEPNKLEAQISQFNRVPELSCVYTDFCLLVNGVPVEAPARPESHSAPGFQTKMLLEWCVLPSTALVRRELAARVRFPEHVRDSEDIIFFLELRNLGPFSRIADPLTFYRRTASQQTEQPDHLFRSTQALFGWFNEHEAEFTRSESLVVRKNLIERLVYPHQMLFWKRDLDGVFRYRKLLGEMASPDIELPSELTKKLYPRWLYCLKDAIESFASR